MSIETRFDIPLIASMALKEKQIQQNYRPIIAVHKWFARRPGTLFRGLMLAEFGDQRLDEEFFVGHDLAGKTIADPFMGGGTPLIEANRLGCDVHGFDINPMASWIVREELEHLDLDIYRKTATALVGSLEGKVGDLYRTDCPHYGDRDVPVKYFLWVKTLPCEQRGETVELFPGYLVADDTRHPRNVIACSSCGELNEVKDLANPGRCASCKDRLALEAPARRGRCSCRGCGHVNAFPRAGHGPMAHRMFAIEYHNSRRKQAHKGRFFKKPDQQDLLRWEKAQERWRQTQPAFVPEDEIPAGDETDRLHHWGYDRYSDLFNARQRLGLEMSCRMIAAETDARLKRALATNLSDLLRYQNMLCRYDTMALKSLDIFSVHGFPVAPVQCESNLLGIVNGQGSSVGSGGWANIIDKYAKAKSYCDAPFEVHHFGGRKVQVPISGEWIGETRDGARPRLVNIRCANSVDVELAPDSLDAVFTDPPYFGNVQYAELMDFCFAWLRKLVPDGDGFERASTRAKDELTVNVTQKRDVVHFTEGLARVFTSMARALKPGAPLVFTYHHNRAEAYHPIGVAVLDSGLTCSASIPCPAEMGGSIHIHGTGSSILDSVFVCRSYGKMKRRHLFGSTAELVRIVRDELGQLRLAGVKPTLGDIRCVTLGHLTRMAIWQLRGAWNPGWPTAEKLKSFAVALGSLGHYQAVIDAIGSPGEARFTQSTQSLPLVLKEERDAVAF